MVRWMVVAAFAAGCAGSAAPVEPAPFADAWYELEASDVALNHGALPESYVWMRTIASTAEGDLFFAGEEPSSSPTDEAEGGDWLWDGRELDLSMSPALQAALTSPRDDAQFTLDDAGDGSYDVTLVECRCVVATARPYSGPWRDVAHVAGW